MRAMPGSAIESAAGSGGGTILDQVMSAEANQSITSAVQGFAFIEYVAAGGGAYIQGGANNGSVRGGAGGATDIITPVRTNDVIAFNAEGVTLNGALIAGASAGSQGYSTGATTYVGVGGTGKYPGGTSLATSRLAGRRAGSVTNRSSVSNSTASIGASSTAARDTDVTKTMTADGGNAFGMATFFRTFAEAEAFAQKVYKGGWKP